MMNKNHNISKIIMQPLRIREHLLSSKEIQHMMPHIIVQQHRSGDCGV